MFCFRGRDCDERLEKHERAVPICSHGLSMLRDWAAEGVGIGSGVRVSRDGTMADMKKLFLPDNDDFAGPGDPDGSKGMREWHDTHGPKDGATPVQTPGRIERRSY